MKKLIFCIALFLFSCSENENPPRVIITDTTPPPVEIPYVPPVDPPDPEPTTGPVALALYSGDALKFYDGDVIWTWKTGKIARAESRSYSAGNILYNLDEYGDTDTSKNLVAMPDYIGIDGGSVWIAENIPPAEAYDLGALYKDYVRVYQDSAEYGNWMTRQYKAENMIIYDNNVFILSSSWSHINGTKTGVKIVIRDGFVCYNYNSSARTATIDGIGVNWSTNFMNSAKYWLKSGGIWYSQNGYSWDGATLTEGGLIMSDWRVAPYLTGYSEGPVIISAGSRFENGEDVLYWIECNSGWLIRHVPSTNQMTLHALLYTGDGYRSTGLIYQNILFPAIISECLYFRWEGSIYRYNLNTGLCGLFASGVLEVWEY